MAQRRAVAYPLRPFQVGRGYPRVVKVANPGAGNQMILPVSSGFAWRPIVVTFLVTTSAVVANRNVLLEYQDGDGTMMARTAAAAFQTASTVRTYEYWAGPYPSQSFTTLAEVFAIPDMFLIGPMRIATNIQTIDAGDTITAVVVTVEEIALGPLGYPEGMVDVAGPGGLAEGY